MMLRTWDSIQYCHRCDDSVMCRTQYDRLSQQQLGFLIQYRSIVIGVHKYRGDDLIYTNVADDPDHRDAVCALRHHHYVVLLCWYRGRSVGPWYNSQD